MTLPDAASAARTALFELQAYIEAAEKNDALYEEKNFDKRTDTIDFIGFHIADRLEELLLKSAPTAKLILLKNRAEQLRAELEEVNISLFQQLQENIRTGRYRGIEFKNLIREYFDFQVDQNEPTEQPAYDNLDLFVNGLFPFQSIPDQTKELEPDMVYYQKTPARVVFELVEKSRFTKEDVFFDLGAGLGQTAILVHLLTGIKVRGVEFEPAFCDYAWNGANSLHLPNVAFINMDARNADYSEGTIFFMFTPFGGEILREVLEILKKESVKRKIRIISYGPCTAEVALQSWLHFENPNNNMYKLGFFSSLADEESLRSEQGSYCLP
jgi:predicted RNA methylase